MARSKITTYYPEKSVRQGYLSLLKEMVSDVISTGWLTLLLFRKNFIANYRQSTLGIFWAFIAPLGSVTIFVILNAGGIFYVGDTRVPYPLFALVSTGVWAVFSGSLTFGLGSLAGAGGMLKRINFPKEVLIFSAVAQAIAPTLIQTVLIFLLFAYLKIAPPLTLFLVPVAVIPLLLLSLGLVFFFSVITVLSRDIGNLVPFAMTVLMYLTPVLYAKPPAGIITTISQYNPFYYLVKIPRDLFLFGSTDHLWAYFYSALLAVVVFWLGWIAFRLSGTKLVEKL